MWAQSVRPSLVPSGSPLRPPPPSSLVAAPHRVGLSEEGERARVVEVRLFERLSECSKTIDTLWVQRACGVQASAASKEILYCCPSPSSSPSEPTPRGTTSGAEAPAGFKQQPAAAGSSARLSRIPGVVAAATGRGFPPLTPPDLAATAATGSVARGREEGM